MGSGATNFAEAFIQHILSTVKFSDFISLSIRGDKMNKSSKLLNKINSTGSYTMNIVLKFLPDPSHDLRMFQKNSQALYLS